jgi:hypothetical protein
MVDEARLRARARRAYETGRLRAALPWAFTGALIATGITAASGLSFGSIAIITAAAFGAISALVMRGPTITRIAAPVLIAITLSYLAVCCVPPA